MGTRPEVTELPSNTRGVFIHYLKVVARFSWIATSIGVVVIAALLGAGSVFAGRNLFTPELLKRFALPLLAYNGSLFFLALPYLVLRATARDR